MSAARTFVGRQDRSRQSFESDSATEKVAAQIGLRGADPVQLRAQETDKVAKSTLSCSVIHSAWTKVSR